MTTVWLELCWYCWVRARVRTGVLCGLIDSRGQASFFVGYTMTQILGGW